MPVKEMSVRHGKPSSAYRDNLDDPSPELIQTLVDAAIRAVVERKDNVQVSFSYIFKWPVGFPKGRLVREEGLSDIRNIPSKKLLDYLFDKEYSKVSYEDVVASFRDLNYAMKGLDSDIKAVESMYNLLGE